EREFDLGPLTGGSWVDQLLHLEVVVGDKPVSVRACAISICTAVAQVSGRCVPRKPVVHIGSIVGIDLECCVALPVRAHPRHSTMPTVHFAKKIHCHDLDDREIAAPAPLRAVGTALAEKVCILA